MERRGTAETDAKAPASVSCGQQTRPDGNRGRLGFRDAGTVQACGLADCAREGGSLGDVPDVFRELGISSRREHMEKSSAVDRAPCRHRLKGRKSDTQCGA